MKFRTLFFSSCSMFICSSTLSLFECVSVKNSTVWFVVVPYLLHGIIPYNPLGWRAYLFSQSPRFLWCVRLPFNAPSSFLLLSFLSANMCVLLSKSNYMEYTEYTTAHNLFMTFLSKWKHNLHPHTYAEDNCRWRPLLLACGINIQYLLDLITNKRSMFCLLVMANRPEIWILTNKQKMKSCVCASAHTHETICYLYYKCMPITIIIFIAVICKPSALCFVCICLMCRGY